MATLNVAIKVNRAITATTTVNANSFAVVTYSYSNSSNLTAVASHGPPPMVTRFYGPGQTIPATFTVSSPYAGNNGNPLISTTTTYALQGGVEFSNTQ